LGIGALILTRKIGLAILAFAIGSLIDQYQQAAKNGQNGTGAGAGNGQDSFDFYRRQSSMYDLPTMLMALSAAVMKADGKVLRIELDYVKNFFSAQFGKQFNATHLQTLKQFLDAPNIPLQDICHDIRTRMTQEVRVQLVHYLFGIAKADGDVGTAEINVISRIATMLGIPAVEFESLRNMFYRNVDSDYKILGIDEKATDEEVKKAYRKMAVAHHPDKVAHMGEEYLKGAKENKFKMPTKPLKSVEALNKIKYV
jgi:DnaJ like chaperone protein